MSDPHVYPESPNGPLTLPAATGIPAPRFIPIEQLAAPDLSTPTIARTMFIRVAMSGADCTRVNSATAPNFYVRADTGDAVLINDHAQPPNQTYHFSQARKQPGRLHWRRLGLLRKPQRFSSGHHLR